MAMASSSRTRVTFIEEVTFGVTPNTPAMKVLRTTGSSLELSKTANRSNEIRDDRQVADLRHGMRSVGGDTDHELVYGDLDEMLAAVLCGTWTNEAAGTPQTLKNGTTERSYSVEVGYTDIGQYKLYSGCVPDKFSIEIKTGGAMVTAKMSWLGKDMDLSNTSADPTPTEPSTNSPIDGFTAVLSEGGTQIGAITGATLNFNNNSKLVEVVGANSAYAIVRGKFEVTGTITVLFTDAVMLNKFINETESSASFVLAGLPSNKTLTINIPRLKYTGAKDSINGDDEIQLEMPFQGLYDAGEDCTVELIRSNPA